jgi:aryl sulfotransferase
MDLPKRTRVYENHHLDSTRWDHFETRPDDILITTAYKSGTTWTQTIVANLLFQDTEIPGAIMDMSPWIDMRARPFDDICATAGAQSHRRFLKTHLPLDGLPFLEDIQYIYVGRDLRDVFMSLLNHYGRHTELFYEVMNNPALLVGDPFPHFDSDVKKLWQGWTQKGWFDWESDGYPYWSSCHHAQTWWDYRQLPNILFIHYGDLLVQPTVEIQRIADFLGIAITPEKLAQVVDAVSFKSMKADSDKVVGGADVFWEGGSKTFLNKGTNGRWRDVLDEDDLLLYSRMMDNNTSPECAAWLEQGRQALTGASVP